MGTGRRTVRELGLALITAGVIVLLFVVYQLWGTGFAERHHQSALAKQFRAEIQQAVSPPAAGGVGTATDPATVTAPRSTPVPVVAVPPGGALAHLVIPRIGLDKYVVEGVSDTDLQKGPGHYPGTAYPGQVGNVGIAGHRTTYGAPFYNLNELKAGDPIYLTTASDAHYTYDVTSQEVVSPSDVAVLNPTPGVAKLTLTTCNPPLSATSRLIVVAELARGTKPAPATPVTHVATPTASPVAAATPLNLGSGNGAAWPPVIGYGAAVVVLWVLTRLAINRTRRWWRLATYAVGIGMCLLPLWFLFENVTNLLPPNI